MSHAITGSAALAAAGLWAVIDTNARAGRRNHEAAPGEFYPLSAVEKTPMPRKHALVFLRDASFKVFDEDGKLVNSLPDAEVPDARKAKLELAPNETIARYDELTVTALRARVAQRPGGLDMDDAKRDSLIEFLMHAPRISEVPAHERDRISEAPSRDDMSAAELDRALPDTADIVNAAGAAGSDPLSMGG